MGEIVAHDQVIWPQIVTVKTSEMKSTLEGFCSQAKSASKDYFIDRLKKFTIITQMTGSIKKKYEMSIVNTVFRFEVAKGHLKWRMTEISRYSGINRALIYYHFGKTKKEIFNHCFEVIMNDFYGLSPEREQLVNSGNLLECSRKSYKLFHDNPEFMAFYFHWRFKKSPIQTRLIEIELAYENRLMRLFPQLHEPQIKAIHAAIQGVVTAPFLKEKEFDLALYQIISPFLKSSPKSFTRG